MCSIGIISAVAMLHRKVKTVNPKCLHHKEKIFFSLPVILIRYEMMSVY